MNCGEQFSHLHTLKAWQSYILSSEHLIKSASKSMRYFLPAHTQKPSAVSKLCSTCVSICILNALQLFFFLFQKLLFMFYVSGLILDIPSRTIQVYLCPCLKKCQYFGLIYPSGWMSSAERIQIQTQKGRRLRGNRIWFIQKGRKHHYTKLWKQKPKNWHKNRL